MPGHLLCKTKGTYLLWRHRNLFRVLLRELIYSSSLSPAQSFLPNSRRHAETYCGNSLQSDCSYWDNKEKDLPWQIRRPNLHWVPVNPLLWDHGKPVHPLLRNSNCGHVYSGGWRWFVYRQSLWLVFLPLRCHGLSLQLQ